MCLQCTFQFAYKLHDNQQYRWGDWDANSSLEKDMANRMEIVHYKILTTQHVFL